MQQQHTVMATSYPPHVAVKLEFPTGTFRRFAIGWDETYDELLARLTQMLGGAPARLLYFDEDGDRISLASQDELTEALTVAASLNVLRLAITSVGEPTGVAAAPASLERQDSLEWQPEMAAPQQAAPTPLELWILRQQAAGSQEAASAQYADAVTMPSIPAPSYEQVMAPASQREATPLERWIAHNQAAGSPEAAIAAHDDRAQQRLMEAEAPQERQQLSPEVEPQEPQEQDHGTVEEVAQASRFHDREVYAASTAGALAALRHRGDAAAASAQAVQVVRQAAAQAAAQTRAAVEARRVAVLRQLEEHNAAGAALEGQVAALEAQAAKAQQEAALFESEAPPVTPTTPDAVAATTLLGELQNTSVSGLSQAVAAELETRLGPWMMRLFAEAQPRPDYSRSGPRDAAVLASLTQRTDELTARNQALTARNQALTARNQALMAANASQLGRIVSLEAELAQAVAEAEAAALRREEHQHQRRRTPRSTTYGDLAAEVARLRSAPVAAAAVAPLVAVAAPACTRAEPRVAMAAGGVRELYAHFVEDITLPDATVVAPGVHTKMWSLRNTGRVAWPEGTVMKFIHGNMRAASDIPVVVPQATPGETVCVQADMAVPDEAGRYRSTWRLCANGVYFGHRVWCDLISNPPPAATTAVASPISDPTPVLLPEVAPASEEQQQQQQQQEILNATSSEGSAVNSVPSSAASTPVYITPAYDFFGLEATSSGEEFVMVASEEGAESPDAGSPEPASAEAATEAAIESQTAAESQTAITEAVEAAAESQAAAEYQAAAEAAVEAAVEEAAEAAVQEFVAARATEEASLPPRESAPLAASAVYPSVPPAAGDLFETATAAIVLQPPAAAAVRASPSVVRALPVAGVGPAPSARPMAPPEQTVDLMQAMQTATLLDQLFDMGFMDVEHNSQLLQEFNNDVDRVVEALLRLTSTFA